MMRRSLIDTIKGLFHSFSQNLEEEPVERRVENARMSQTRLKALKPIELCKEYQEPQPEVFDESDPATIPKRIKSLASMSHYRLSALAAILPAEMLEESITDADFENRVVEASQSQTDLTSLSVGEDQAVGELAFAV